MAAFGEITFEADCFCPLDTWVLFYAGRMVWIGEIGTIPSSVKNIDMIILNPKNMPKDDRPDFMAITREVANG